MNWENKTTVQKGNLGEEIVYNNLINKGLIPYKPIYEGAHPFDFLCATKNKKNIVIVDAKAKARMNNKIDGSFVTGIDTKHFNDYKYLSEKHGIPVHIYFVDEHPKEKRIYGNSLTILEKTMFERTFKGTKITLFRLENMIHVAFLTSNQAESLMEKSTRTYAYDGALTKVTQ